MKKNFLLIMCALLLLCGCKKDKMVPAVRLHTETPRITTTTNTAAVEGSYIYAGTPKSVVIAYGKDSSLSSPQKVTAEHTRDSYSVTISNLESGTTYYFHCIFDTGYGTAESEQWSFTTQSIVIPSVTTSSVTNITQTSAACGGNVTSDGGATVTARGVCWSTSQNPTVSNSHTTNGNGTGSFTSSITGLTANTKYYVRAYATNSKGTSYGKQKSFTTDNSVPTVTTASVSNITKTIATCGGNVTSDGGAAVTARGVCWSTSQNPTVSDSHTTDGSGTGSFTSIITGLTANTTYYVRAYATNSAGTSYGEQKSFTTQSGGGGDHEYVDLGLPSGLLWATCNVGADKPEDYGYHFAWGETTTKSTYDWSTYKWYNGSAQTLTKYNTDPNCGTVDNKTVLDPEDDAAHVNWGGGWRMPTAGEWQELYDNTTSTWTTENGVRGRKFTSKTDSSKYIFLPVSSRAGTSLSLGGYDGVYWSSSLNSSKPYTAYSVHFDSDYVALHTYLRFYGDSVRPVCR